MNSLRKLRRRYANISQIVANSGGSPFGADFNAVLARAKAIPTTNLPSASNQAKLDALFKSLRRGGAGWEQSGLDLIGEIELLYVHANDAADRVFGRINLITPGTFDSTEAGGSMTKVDNVGIFGTSTIYATTGWKPLSNKVKIGASDLSMFAWVKDFVNGIAGVETDSTNRFRILSGDYGVNSARATHTSISTDGFWMINSYASIMYKWWKGILIDDGSFTAGTLSDFILPITASNVAGAITGRTTKVGIFGVGKKMSLHEVPLYSCFDEYMNGPWPIKKTYSANITPAQTGLLDYMGFPEIVIADNGDYLCTFSEGYDHGITAGGVVSQMRSSDKGLTWSTKTGIVASGYTKQVVLSGTTGTGVGTINGFQYTATFNTNLQTTAANFVTTHGALLSSRGVIVTAPGGGILLFESNNEAFDLPVTWDGTNGVGGAVSYNYGRGDQAYGKTASGRILFMYTRVAGQLRVPMLKYSDDHGVTWSPSQQYISYFGSVGQGAGPGNAVTLPNGDMLKAEYGTVEDRAANPSATRTVYIFKCLAADNGLVWSYLSRITGNRITLSGTTGTANININGTDYLATFTTNLTTSAANFVTTHGATLSGLGITVTAATGVLTFTYTGAQRILTIANVTGDLYGQFTEDFEEPTLLVKPNGNILITLRSDPLKTTYMSESSDNGATWSNPYYHSPSWGKNPICCNTDGSVIITYGRWPGNTDVNASYALISLSTDGGTTWRWRLVDNVKHWYMYAGIVFDSTNNTFTAVYGRETNDDYVSGSILLLNKFSL